MMIIFFKNIGLVGLLSLIISVSNAQNLISNGDFETFISLPTTQGQVLLAAPWDNMVLSADYLNTTYNGWNTHTGGAHSGTGFAGFATYGNASGSAEAIGQNISATPIVAGTTYNIGVYAKKTTGSSYNQNCGGVAFYGFPTTPIRNLVSAHAGSSPGANLLWTSAMVSNTTWAFFSGTFTATANLNFLVITMPNTPNCGHYVYIDSVYISIVGSGNSIFDTICQGDSVFAAGVYQKTTGIYRDTLLASDGSDSIITTNLTVNPLPVISTSPGDTLICSGGNISLFAFGGASYFWDNGLGSGQTHSVSPTTPTDYVVVAIDSNGCMGSDSVSIDVKPPVVISASEDDTVCPGELANISVLGSLTYNWDNGLGAGSNFTVSPSVATKYIVTGVDADGCTGKDSVMIRLFSNPVADFSMTPNPAIIDDPSVNFTDQSSTSVVLWDWYFGNLATSSLQNPFYRFPFVPGSYPVTLIVENDNGCKDTIIKTLVVKGEYGMYVPNSFTPNEDGINDEFIPIMYGVEEENYSLRVFNRWGELIFETTDITESWDGKNLNELVPIDTYTWKISCTDISGLRREEIGAVNVIR